MPTRTLKERPIVLDLRSVQGFLLHNKTQLHRVVRPQRSLEEPWPDRRSHLTWGDVLADPAYYVACGWCPLGCVGDRLWAKEGWRLVGWDFDDNAALIQYRDGVKRRYTVDGRSDYEGDWLIRASRRVLDLPHVHHNGDESAVRWECDDSIPWRSPMHLPRWATRLVLEVVSVRAERLQDISERDCVLEGCAIQSRLPGEQERSFRGGFSAFWDSINAPRGHAWAANPYVWVATLHPVEQGN